MSTLDYILDLPLKESQDFDVLKKKGLTHLNGLIGTNWSNHNPSDPGVVILDQLCYALTELGYCLDFPIEDILTGEDGEFESELNFFKPIDLLTTAPILDSDYIRLIVDQVDGVQNAQIIPFRSSKSLVHGVYQVYLCVEEDIKESEYFDLETEVYELLNRNRNLGEQFLFPDVMEPSEFSFSGEIVLENDAHGDLVIAKVKSTIQEYLTPEYGHQGYNEMKLNGFSDSQIFNGPKLENGWITVSQDSSIKEYIKLSHAAKLIDDIEGVKEIKGLRFVYNGEAISDKTLRFNIGEYGSILIKRGAGGLTLSKNQKELNQQFDAVGKAFSNEIKAFKAHQNIGGKVSLEPEFPKGRYREIEDYYSVQMTFPSIYGLGLHVPGGGANDHRKAQTKQLQGYLMAFDQILANQLSQLANIGELFSFKAKNRSPLKSFDEEKQFKYRQHSKYPKPYQNFDQTYFFQTLYDIPDVRSLLLGNDSHLVVQSGVDPKMIQENSWKEYKSDPYNPYVNGLVEKTESEAIANDRKNRVLNHLLARHGEDYDLIESYCSASWFNDDLEKLIAVKSDLMQNYASLSYNRTQGLNFLKTFDAPEYGSRVVYGNTDFDYHSGIELRMDVVLGITEYYTGIIQLINGQEDEFSLFDEKAVTYNLTSIGLELNYKEELVLDVPSSAVWASEEESFSAVQGQLEWLVRHTQGGVFIEHQLFLRAASFRIFIKEKRKGRNRLLLLEPGEAFEYEECMGVQFQLMEANPQVRISADVIEFVGDNFNVQYLYQEVDKSTFSGQHEPVFSSVDKTYEVYIEAKWGDDLVMPLEHPFFHFKTTMVLPEYVSLIKQEFFKSNLLGMYSEFLPAHISNSVQYLDFDNMRHFIELYEAWRGFLRVDHEQGSAEYSDTAAQLINLIIESKK